MKANREVTNHIMDGMDGMEGMDDMDGMNAKQATYLKLFCLFGTSRGSNTDTMTFVFPISMYADPFAFDITFSLRTEICLKTSNFFY